MVVWSAENLVDAFKDRQGKDPDTDDFIESAVDINPIGLRLDDGTVRFEKTTTTAYYSTAASQAVDLAALMVSRWFGLNDCH